MREATLKLKQASAVLEISPKDLQNLVQFGVVRPRRNGKTFYFDAETLLACKVASYLRETLMPRTEILVQLLEAFRLCERRWTAKCPRYVEFRLRQAGDEPSLRVAVPVRSLQGRLERRMRMAPLYRDLPRGRKPRGWRAKFLKGLEQAAKDLGRVSRAEVARTIREHRSEKRVMEITVAARS